MGLLAAVRQIYNTVMPPKRASSRGRSKPLIGRVAECGELDSLLEDLRRGESRSLVIRGEAGVGKTALLSYLKERAADCRVIGVTAVQSEMELAFATLHQLCASILDGLRVLPAPQREALGVIFGLTEGPVPDRFLVGLAVLSLPAEAAERRPLLCLVDDEQWLDHASAQVLAFVARRLGMEFVGLIFSTRSPGDELTGLPELVLGVLDTHDARTLLETVLAGPVDSLVRDEIIAETGGNPLALLELPRGLSPTDLAGGFGLPGALALSGNIEEAYRRRISALTADTRRLLLLAAAEPSENRCWCGELQTNFKLRDQQQTPQSTPTWSSSRPEYGFAIPWCARPYTTRRQPQTDRRRTGHLPRSQIRNAILTAERGIAPRPLPGQMRK